MALSRYYLHRLKVYYEIFLEVMFCLEMKTYLDCIHFRRNIVGPRICIKNMSDYLWYYFYTGTTIHYNNSL